ncbi:uncharacterized protein MONOS_9338 [Monocercomonoides exilis]|uniref:uncharacterized protein n=1 Tax=Monocercomonoides exilis TaxID=2049356 RepID=UPI00355A7E16|nr:hypothetical protein MONOS_9338 [Monocercomonoides exilis]|eukprot:MONOS_9338.1-p1 / transcript=MONOS_9338.1 / gene=MONOS_9338 / organism=Monocercomonoides_exilis_PA203 / gene_product=unspecified product / transcript_product=unspecified product / location=Mono_scaffold00382:18181-19103(-) / protein_length=239 / sequence_SO=supercontig / SO=protein_coding / is_pseudo=false
MPSESCIEEREKRGDSKRSGNSITGFEQDRLEDTVANELHFVGEAARELEELARCIDWKKKEEMNKEEAKEEFALTKWDETIVIYFFRCELWNEELVELFRSMVRVFRAARENKREISYKCIYTLRNAAERRVVKVEDLLKGEAVDAVLEEIQRQTLNEGRTNECFQFFMNVSRKLKEKTDNKMEEEERRSTKMEIFEKLEEEGYEDTITSFHKIFDFLYGRYCRGLTLKISDYLVNA